MSYVVNWRGSDGQAGWHPVGDLPEAAAHVEHLRNAEGVTETKIFKLDEVAFEFRPYFRVELAADEPAVPTFAVPAVAEPAPEPEPAPDAVTWSTAPEVAAVEPIPAADVAELAPEPVLVDAGEHAASNGQRRGLFGR